MRFWRFIEDIPGGVAPERVWRDQLGDEFDWSHRLRDPQAKLAASLPLEADTAHHVVAHLDGCFVAVHPESGDVTVVPRNDLILWQLSIERLSRSIAECIGAVPMPVAVGSGLWRVGHLPTEAGQRLSVLLLLAHDGDLAAAGLARCVTLRQGPSLLLATSSRHLPSNADSDLARERCSLELLEPAVARGSPGELLALPGLQYALRQFVTSNSLLLPRHSHACGSVPPGSTWRDVRICFIDPEAVRIEVKGQVWEERFESMGFRDGRTNKPNRQWQLLCDLADGEGRIRVKDLRAADRDRQRRSALSRTLQQYFGLDGKPVRSDLGDLVANFQIKWK